MQASKLQLEQYFVDEASFRLKEAAMSRLDGKLPVLESSDMEIEIHLGEHKDEPLKSFCQLDVKLKQDVSRRFPYTFKIVMVGFFELSGECTAQERDVLMTNSAPSMLYTAAREYLLTMTGRTRYFPIQLPTVLFIPKQQTNRARSNKPKGKSTGARGAAKKATRN